MPVDKLTPEAERLLLKQATKPAEPTPSQFTNPWPIPEADQVFSGPSQNAKRISFTIPIEHWNFFKLVRMDIGTMPVTLCLLLQALRKECEKRGIKDLTKRADFETLVANCKITETKK
jgi:hypothetical protein